MFLISVIRKVFMIVVSVTQIDIALFAVLIKELTSMVIVKLLVDKKTFGVNNYSDELIEVA